MTNATEADFDREVIERSRSVPVVVDFWAPWCGPCRALGPALEAEVESREGQVWLVKVNSDENPQVAARYQVRSIPLVKAFFGGRVVHEMLGAQPRSAITAFFDLVCPSEEERAMGEAAKLLDDGRDDGVEALLAPALASARHRDAALLLLARFHVLKHDQPRAEETLRLIEPSSPEHARAQALMVRWQLLGAATGGDEAGWRARVEIDPADAEARWSLAGLLLGSGRTKEALDELLEILIRDRKFRDDGARRAMLAVFEDIGTDHELSHHFRRQMQIYL
jgi:putative thioredoxin